MRKAPSNMKKERTRNKKRSRGGGERGKGREGVGGGRTGGVGREEITVRKTAKTILSSQNYRDR